MSSARVSPAFRKAERYARTIPQKTDKRRAVRHLCKLWRAALKG